MSVVSSGSRVAALRIWDVVDRTGMSKTHVYRLAKAGKFPPPHKLSERISGWSEVEVENWLKAKLHGAQLDE